MDLQLALFLSSSSSSSSSFTQSDLKRNSHDDDKMQDLNIKRKLCFNGGDHHEEEEEDHGIYHRLETLPLLFCRKSDNNDDDDVNEVQSTYIFINDHKNGEEENNVIGWPPVRYSRKKFCHRKNHNDDGHVGLKSMYVKVQMEGDGIARKIDLNLYHSYETLIHTLAQMFGKCNEDVKLTYQDKEGDWLLAGDIPWGSFIESVQRLKLLKVN